MLVNVCYRVPVVAVVDTETGKIERVIVDDVSISKPEYCETSDDCRALPDKNRHAQRAVKIAESQEWPAWSIGF